MQIRILRNQLQTRAGLADERAPQGSTRAPQGSYSLRNGEGFMKQAGSREKGILRKRFWILRENSCRPEPALPMRAPQGSTRAPQGSYSFRNGEEFRHQAGKAWEGHPSKAVLDPEREQLQTGAGLADYKPGKQCKPLAVYKFASRASVYTNAFFAC